MYELWSDNAEPDWTGTLDDFLDQDLAPEERAAAIALQPGDEATYGGGAAPIFRLRRVA